MIIGVSTDLDTGRQIVRTIRTHPALSDFPEAAQQRIAGTAVLNRVGRRSAVTIPPDAFALISFGLVKSATDVNGGEFVTRLSGSGETIGLYESMKTGESPRERAVRHTVITESATVVLVKTLAVLNELTTTRAAHVFALACGAQEDRMLERLIAAANGSSESRIASMLLDLVERFGDVREDGSAFIPFHLRRAELAAICGITQETMIRKMSAWSRTGLITDGSVENGGGIEISNIEDLRKLVTT